MTRQTLAVLGLSLVAVLGWFTWAALQPPAARPNVKVRFAGYTNDTIRGRVAMFTVTNTGSSAVRRFSNYMVQIPTGARWTTLSAGLLPGNGSVLQPGSSETVTIPAATNQSWRVSLSINPEVGIMSDLMGSIAKAARSARLPIRYRNISYGVPSDRIGE
ncbi:MAG TPA: hypothetical protein VHI52_12985 [Verrucomicrobiae bacterium]|nr:hypothetical protein [Verrucomicrobiae bacterium]